MRILFISTLFPYPLRTGSSVTNYNAIKQLARRHEISLLSFIDSEEELQYVPAMTELCTDVTCVLRKVRPVSGLKRVLSLSCPAPRSVVIARSREMFEAVARKVSQTEFDCAIADGTHMLEYLIQAKGFPKILYHHNVDSVIVRRLHMTQPSKLKRLRGWLTWRKAAAHERRMNKLPDAHIVVSEVDKAELLTLVPGIERIAVVGNGVDIDSFRVDGVGRQRNSIIFTGLPKYGANMDGLRYFHREIFPMVKQKWNDAVLRVTGDCSGQDVRDLVADKNVVLTGFLDDIKTAVASSWISIAPIRVGSGTRLKILEAMALGTPVVSTTVGAEGLDVTREKDILLADDPSDFAQQILRLRDDVGLWNRLSENGKRLVREKYDWKILGKQLDSFVHEVCSKDAGRKS